MSKRTDMAVEAVELDYKYDENKVINGLDYKKLTVDKELGSRIKKEAGIYYNIDNLDYHSNYDNIIDLVKNVFKELMYKEYKSIKNILIVKITKIYPENLLANSKVLSVIFHFSFYLYSPDIKASIAL